jgi:hypothetical protein
MPVSKEKQKQKNNEHLYASFINGIIVETERILKVSYER